MNTDCLALIYTHEQDPCVRLTSNTLSLLSVRNFFIVLDVLKILKKKHHRRFHKVCNVTSLGKSIHHLCIGSFLMLLSAWKGFQELSIHPGHPTNKRRLNAYFISTVDRRGECLWGRSGCLLSFSVQNHLLCIKLTNSYFVKPGFLCWLNEVLSDL